MSDGDNRSGEKQQPEREGWRCSLEKWGAAKGSFTKDGGTFGLSTAVYSWTASSWEVEARLIPTSSRLAWATHEF